MTRIATTFDAMNTQTTPFRPGLDYNDEWLSEITKKIEG